MQTIIILLALSAITLAAPPPQSDRPVAQIIRSNSNINPDGSYAYSFETDDGYSREETGSVVNPGQENTFIAVLGSYKYFSPEGEVVEVHYSSDDRGFVPVGTHISELITNSAKALSQTKVVE